MMEEFQHSLSRGLRLRTQGYHCRYHKVPLWLRWGARGGLEPDSEHRKEGREGQTDATTDSTRKVIFRATQRRFFLWYWTRMQNAVQLFLWIRTSPHPGPISMLDTLSRLVTDWVLCRLVAFLLLLSG